MLAAKSGQPLWEPWGQSGQGPPTRRQELACRPLWAWEQELLRHQQRQPSPLGLRGRRPCAEGDGLGSTSPRGQGGCEQRVKGLPPRSSPLVLDLHQVSHVICKTAAGGQGPAQRGQHSPCTESCSVASFPKTPGTVMGLFSPGAHPLQPPTLTTPQGMLGPGHVCWHRWRWLGIS